MMRWQIFFSVELMIGETTVSWKIVLPCFVDSPSKTIFPFKSLTLFIEQIHLPRRLQWFRIWKLLRSFHIVMPKWKIMKSMTLKRNIFEFPKFTTLIFLPKVEPFILHSIITAIASLSDIYSANDRFVVSLLQDFCKYSSWSEHCCGMDRLKSSSEFRFALSSFFSEPRVLFQARQLQLIPPPLLYSTVCFQLSYQYLTIFSFFFIPSLWFAEKRKSTRWRVFCSCKSTLSLVLWTGFGDLFLF